jgi:hypothetical protein
MVRALQGPQDHDLDRTILVGHAQMATLLESLHEYEFRRTTLTCARIAPHDVAVDPPLIDREVANSIQQPTAREEH